MGLFSSIIGGIVGFFVGGPVGAVIGAGIGATKIGEKAVNAVLDFVLQPFLGNMDQPAASDPGQQGVLVTRQGTNQSIPVIYGYRKAGGIITFAETGSTNNQYLWVAYVFSEGLVEGLNELWIDDNPLGAATIAALNAGQTVNVQDGKYKDRTVMRWYPGVYYTTPSSSPVAADVGSGVFNGAPSWNNKMIYNGLAVLFVRYEWKKATTQAEADNNPFSGGIPNVQAGILGKKIIGLATKKYTASGAVDAGASATMLTNVNSYWNSNTTYDRNQGRYSTNPVEILFDYLRNPQYGKGLFLTDIDKTTWVNAANKCNQLVTYYTGAVGPIMTCNYVLETNVTLFNNVKYLLSGFRAYMPYIQGKYKLKIEDAGSETDILSGQATIVDTITKNEIVGDVTYTGIERTAKFNQVVVTYVDPDQKWSPQQAVWPRTEAERQVFIAEDGNRENKSEVTMNTLTNSIMALDMARLIFNKSRYQESCNIKISAQAFEYEPGDNIYIQSNILNFGTTPWRIISIKLNSDYTFDVACVRNPDNIYPYGRYNEPDLVRSPYIPKGNEIYWPGVGKPLIGIFPPGYAIVPGTYTPTSTNPSPTDPNSSTSPGGGIGGSTGSTSNGTTTVSTIPNTPAVVTYNHIVTFTGFTYDATTNNFIIYFTKPDIATYAGVRIWYRTSATTNYYVLPDIGPTDTSFRFPALTADTGMIYYLVSRVKYDNAQFSTDSNNVQVGQTTGLTSTYRVSGYDFTSISIQRDVINPNAEINLINYTVALTTPKTVTFTFKEAQSRYTDGSVSSNKMTAAYLYYRPVGSSLGYTEYVYALPATYLPNAQFSFVLQDFGTTTTDYEIIMRWKMSDGTMGNLIFTQTINVASAGTATASFNGVALASSKSIVVQAAGTSSANQLPTVNDIQGFSGSMKVFIKDPSVAPEYMTNFIGATVDIASVTPGTISAYTTYNFSINNSMTKTFGADEYSLNVGTIAYGYYNIIVRLAYASSGSTLYSTKAIKYYGLFNPNGGSAQISNMVKLPGSDYALLKGDSGSSTGTSGVILTPSSITDLQTPASGASSTSTVKVASFAINFTRPSSISKIRVYRQYNTGTNSIYEYTDLTASGTVRYAVNPTAVQGGYYVAASIYDTFKQTIYIRTYDSSNAASNAVLKISPQFNGNLVNVMGVPFDSMGNTINLSTDTALSTALSGARNAASNIISYNLTTGWTSGVIQ